MHQIYSLNSLASLLMCEYPISLEFAKTFLVDPSASGRRGTLTRLCLRAVSSGKVDSYPTPCKRSLRETFGRAYTLRKPHVKNWPCSTSRLVGKTWVNTEYPISMLCMMNIIILAQSHTSSWQRVWMYLPFSNCLSYQRWNALSQKLKWIFLNAKSFVKLLFLF